VRSFQAIRVEVALQADGAAVIVQQVGNGEVDHVMITACCTVTTHEPGRFMQFCGWNKLTKNWKYREGVLYALQAVFVLGVAFIAFRLGHYDLRIPFHYGGDTVIILMFIKGILLNGWSWDIPQLSAPYGMSAVAFPLMTSFDWLIMKGISLFTSEPGLVLNLFWLFTLVLSAWSAAVALRLFGIHLIISLGAGVLYAFLPFALLRNVNHLNLVYYLVPFLSLLAVYIASGLRIGNGQWIRRVTYAACLAQGFNYIYFSFFSVLLFGFAAIYGYVNHRSSKTVNVAAVAIVLIIGATAINLSPTFYSWYKYRKPPEMDYKYPLEAEGYGAKIRRMIVPHKDNPVPIIGDWGKADALAGYPGENENVTARLGLVGTAGFILLLLISLQLVKVDAAGAHAGTLHSLAALTFFALLMITVGGFGAIFNLAVAPDIRAYNRFTVFVSFFSLAGLGLFIERYRCTFSGRANWKLLLPMSLVACFSLYDQLLDRSVLLLSQNNDIARYHAEKALLDRFKRLYPNGVSTIQLPITGFPINSIHENMESYDHLRPFLWSDSRMRWSWPSFSQRHRAWQDRISKLEGDALVKAAIYSGFLAIWIDRFGYKDRGAKLIAGLLAAGGRVVLSDNRHVIVDLHEEMENVKSNESPEEFRGHVDAWINGIALSWGRGFYGAEINPQGVPFRWSTNNSEIIIKNFSNHKRSGEFEFDIASEASGTIDVAAGSAQWSLSSETRPSRYRLNFDVDGESTVVLNFHTDIAKVNAPNDSRELYFYVASPIVRYSKTMEQNR